MRFISLIKVVGTDRLNFGRWITQVFSPAEVRIASSMTELNINLAVDPPLKHFLFDSDAAARSCEGAGVFIAPARSLFPLKGKVKAGWVSLRCHLPCPAG